MRQGCPRPRARKTPPAAHRAARPPLSPMRSRAAVTGTAAARPAQARLRPLVGAVSSGSVVGNAVADERPGRHEGVPALQRPRQVRRSATRSAGADHVPALRGLGPSPLRLTRRAAGEGANADPVRVGPEEQLTAPGRPGNQGRLLRTLARRQPMRLPHVRLACWRAGVLACWRAGGLAGWRAGGLAGWRATALRDLGVVDASEGVPCTGAPTRVRSTTTCATSPPPSSAPGAAGPGLRRAGGRRCARPRRAARAVPRTRAW
jgi:hypothetical protein